MRSGQLMWVSAAPDAQIEMEKLATISVHTDPEYV